ncbi:MAG: AraC family transcriptional regulator [Eubacteriales bacterium]|nr:AraC family transcriptional regulator [Eubacteriales bacterium]
MGRRAKAVVEYREYELAPDFPIVALDGDDWLISDILSERQHFHNCMEIGLCRTEGGSLYFGTEKSAFQAGDVSCVSHHVVHTTCSTAGCKSKWAYLFVEPVGLLGHEAYSSLGTHYDRLCNDHRLIHQEDQPSVHFLITQILHEMDERRHGYQEAVKSLFFLFCRELLALSQNEVERTERKHTFALQPALDHIHRFYTQPVTVEELAEMCHLSTPHFRATFCEAMGMPPLRFVHETRIKRACEMLRMTDESILSVSAKTGFTCISSFNRCFLQLIGISPKAYRQLTANLPSKGMHTIHYQGWTKPESVPRYHSLSEATDLPKP